MVWDQDEFSFGNCVMEEEDLSERLSLKSESKHIGKKWKVNMMVSYSLRASLGVRNMNRRLPASFRICKIGFPSLSLGKRRYVVDGKHI